MRVRHKAGRFVSVRGGGSAGGLGVLVLGGCGGALCALSLFTTLLPLLSVSVSVSASVS